MGLFDKLKKTKQGNEAPLAPHVSQEIEEALRFLVVSGFYSQSEIQIQAREIVDDICRDQKVTPPSDAYINQTVERLISSVTPYTSDNYLRLRNVFDALNRERIIAIHYAGYTLDDGFEEVETVFQFMKSNNIPRRGYCFYHQQDIERAMNDSMQFLMLAFHSMNDDKQIAMEVGERVAELLTQNGFIVEWDHSAGSRIKIKNFCWDKTCDGEDYGADRAIRIMREAHL
jgi:hypothetical protein